MAPCDFGYAACGQAPRGAQTSYVTYIGGMAQGPVGFTTGNADITTSHKRNPAIPGAPKQCFCAHLRARLPLPVALEAAFARPRDRARGDHDGRRAASSGDEQQNDRGHGGSQVAAAGRRACCAPWRCRRRQLGLGRAAVVAGTAVAMTTPAARWRRIGERRRARG